jgi:hypothetical protein
MKSLALIAAVVFALPVQAQSAKEKDPKPAAKKSTGFDLDLPSFKAIPKGEEMQSATPKAGLGQGQTTSSFDSSYEVTKVVHARSFARAAGGASPVGGALESILLGGNPLKTERFQTVVRVKSPQRTGASIDVVILDPRGDTTMEASGTVNFRQANQDEAEWTVEWEPTTCRSGGDYKVMVRVAGQVMGSWPLKLVEKR